MFAIGSLDCPAELLGDFYPEEESIEDFLKAMHEWRGHFRRDTRAQAYRPHLGDRQWLISFMTEAELEQWAILSNWHEIRRMHGLQPQRFFPEFLW
jgi:hypothetical protein